MWTLSFVQGKGAQSSAASCAASWTHTHQQAETVSRTPRLNRPTGVQDLYDAMFVVRSLAGEDELLSDQNLAEKAVQELKDGVWSAPWESER